MDFFNRILSLVMHVVIITFLVIYVPLSFLWRLIFTVFVRPFTLEDMKDKVVLITGASSGIGEQLAYQYAKRGASLVLVARREKALHVVAEAARANGARDVLVITADVSSQEDSKRAIDESITHFGRLNHLVANAGICGSCLFEEIENISAFTQVMDVNFWGAVYPTYYAIPHLKNSRGRIIVNASVAGRVPLARMGFYNASKVAVIRFYETLRAELGSEVPITILTMGWFSSELTKGKILQKGGELKVNEEIRDAQVGFFPVGRSDKCAEVIVDSACRGDKYVTWPTWYKPFHMLMCAAPELIDLFSRSFFVAKPGDAPSRNLSRRLLEISWIKGFVYPSSIRSENKKSEINE